MFVSNLRELCGVFLLFKAVIALADSSFAQPLAGFEGGYVGGNVLTLVHKLGIGLDEANKLIATHLLFAGLLLREA